MATPTPSSLAPTGAVTLAFTDIEGSTNLWERHPDAMRAALEIHNRVMRAAIAAAGGYEVKTEGDAFMVAFGDPLSALRWCLDCQTALLSAEWPAEVLAESRCAEEHAPDGTRIRRGVRVRMGVHAGEPDCRPDPVTGRMDYFGPMVNRAARIGSAGHGGQVLVSETVWKQVEGSLGTLPVTVVDTGLHRLRDLEYAERLYQVLPKALAARTFPPLRTVDARKTNLTPHPTPFVGREADLEAIASLFSKGERLVTLLGPGGTGKTRLSMRYAAVHLDDFTRDGGGGTWFFDLTEARDLEGIAAVVGQVLAVPLVTGKTVGDVLSQLGHAIAGRKRMLLVLDNFEQIISHAPETIARWMSLAPEARFLVNSQERLRLPGEVAYELQPLGLPDEKTPAAESEAVKLFVQRARAVRRDFTLTPADLPAVVEIVRALDGIPLAIELAAARVGVLSPSKLLERLPRRFDLLGGARRDATARQSTLRGAIDWSWNLLQPHEKEALAQASVFAGGFSLEAAEEVLDLSAHPGAPWPLDVVQALRDKSLLRAWEPAAFPGEMRFGMYSNIREYASEKLRELGKTDAMRARRADYYLRVAGEWARALEQHGGFEPLERLALEWENLAAVLERALEAPPTVESVIRAMRAIDVLDPVLSTRGPFGRHLTWLDAVLALASKVEVDRPLHAKVLELRGRARRARGQPRLEDFDDALVIARSTGDRAQEGRLLAQKGFSLFSLGRMEEARAAIEQGLALAIAAGDEDGQAHALGTLGVVAAATRQPEEARSFYDRSLALHRRRGNARFEAALLGNLGLLHYRQGRLDEAEAHYRQALEISRKVGDRRFEGNNLGRIGLLQLERERFDDARSSLTAAIAIQRVVGNRTSEGMFLGNLGIVELECGHFSEAASALDDAAKILAETGEKSGTAVFGGFRAVALVRRGDLAGAEALLAESEKIAASLDDTTYSVVLGVLRGALDHANGDAASATKRVAVDPALANGSEDLRLALRIVRKLAG